MPKIEMLATRLQLAAKHHRGGALIVTVISPQVDTKVTTATQDHPDVERILFPDEASLQEGFRVLKQTQFETDAGKLQIITMPQDVYINAMSGKLGPDIQKDVSDAFARRIGTVDEE